MKHFLKMWRDKTLVYMKLYQNKILVIHYEDLQTNLEDNLRKMLRFLDFPVNEVNNIIICWNFLALLRLCSFYFQKDIRCTLRNSDGSFKRTKSLYDPYTNELHRKASKIKEYVYSKIKETEI